MPDCFFRATKSEKIYLEVLEFSDWESDTDAQGDPSYAYELTVVEIVETELEKLLSQNDSAPEVLAQIRGGETQYYSSLFGSDSTTVTPMHGVGQIESAGDKDIYVVALADGACLQFSLFLTALSDLDGRVELYFEECDTAVEGDCTGMNPDLVVSTKDLEYGIAEDATAFKPAYEYQAPAAGVAYLEITDDSGGSGSSYWYNLLVASFSLGG